MAIAVSDIQVDKCFVTSTGEVRRVLMLEGGNVTYETRLKTDKGGSAKGKTTVGDRKFASTVDREITC